ncbi:hypothetical protein BDV98DRAFT_581631 [Pterulicium gracile]|uniref:Uncharacterized protein n=1 Tax=Pterulicium gracile TaxID=1884261 RepID=A0A5C3QL61_9AGAR|nr:hypothetical protein BDV98DRAFT_581631 [Pterula gracilis]
MSFSGQKLLLNSSTKSSSTSANYSVNLRKQWEAFKKSCVYNGNNDTIPNFFFPICATMGVQLVVPPSFNFNLHSDMYSQRKDMNSIQQGQFFLQQTFTHGSVLPTKDSELLEFLSGNPVIKLLEFKFSMNGTGCDQLIVDLHDDATVKTWGDGWIFERGTQTNFIKDLAFGLQYRETTKKRDLLQITFLVNKLERDQLHTLNITVGKINQEDGTLQPGEAQFTELLASVNVNSPESTATPSAKGSVPTSKGLDESQPE